jgi:hypothetical protein
MFRMLTGRLPFVDQDATHLLAAHRLEAAPPPSSVLRAIPAQVDALVLTALAKEPGARYPTMERFEAAIARVETDLKATRPAGAAALGFLRSIEAVASDRLYELFDVPDGASGEMIRRAAAQLSERIAELRATAAPNQVARLDAAEQRIAAAEALLLDPRRRASWDAAHGNFLGVAREISRGFDLGLLSALREEFVLDHPTLMLPQPYPTVPQPPQGPQAEAVAAELARRLREDPLNIDLHRRYWPLRHALRKRAAREEQPPPA